MTNWLKNYFELTWRYNTPQHIKTNFLQEFCLVIIQSHGKHTDETAEHVSPDVVELSSALNL